jgi:hypothetical protein
MSNYVGKYDICGLPQGADFELKLYYQFGEPPTTLDLTGYSGALQVRRNYDSPVLLELSSLTATIAFSATAPNITITFPADYTESMSVFEDMIYDLEITSPANLKTRVMEGNFSISRQVTK